MISVAVVEDDALLRKSLVTLIEEAPGFRCVCACSTGEEALQTIPQAAPHVVVMDIHLPRISGVECTRRLKEACPDLAVLVLTVYEDSETIFEALRAGARGYLLKRRAADELIPAIQEVKEGGAPMTSLVARRVVDSFRASSQQKAGTEGLSEREQEILECLCKGFANKEIAEHLSISHSTVCTHLRHIYEKLHVRSRTEAVLRFKHD